MNPKLVSSAGSWVKQHMGGHSPIPPLHRILRHRFLRAGRFRRKFLPVFDVPTNSQFDQSSAFLGNAPNQCLVDPGDGMELELRCKSTMCSISLRNHHDTGRFFVQPVDNSGPAFVANSPEGRAVMQ